ncbi:MAG: hypothetical protein Q4B52_05425 [Tissierellia bacterium]|nr:hypothetical protein [Tissierellia bacterium]
MAKKKTRKEKINKFDTDIQKAEEKINQKQTALDKRKELYEKAEDELKKAKEDCETLKKQKKLFLVKDYSSEELLNIISMFEDNKEESTDEIEEIDEIEIENDEGYENANY